ncbi:MAG: Ankyrin [Capsulimonas sp.]|jgi:hypothetical protein|nr:Ankyrin [Capsulimonas sp.]
MTTSQGIDLDQYKTQARDLLRQVRAALPEAIARLRTHHPEGERLALSPRIQLADAQLTLARELEYGSWAKLKEHLLFLQTVRALDAGDMRALTTLLDKCPALIRYHCHRGEYGRGYFGDATLLHHIAGNPIRGPIPPNVMDIARELLARGADPNAVANTSTTIDLLITSRQASEAGVAVPLINLLVAAGASDHVLRDPDLLSQPLWNGGRATAETLVRSGSRMDARHAAALGRLDILPGLLGDNPTSQSLEEALVYACVQNEEEAVRYLVGRGAKGDVNASPGGQSSALHNAAWRGNTRIVTLLMENGAHMNGRDTQWNGVPADWAEHGGHAELAALMRGREDIQGAT